MNRTHTLWSAACIVIALAFSMAMRADEPIAAPASSAAANASAPSAPLWTDRGDIGSLDLFYGSGGKEHQPTGKFTFLKEDKEGTSPKFDVVDEQGVHWRAKLGDESKAETAATRLVWAAGYFTDEDYYLPELRVDKLPRLDRGRQFVSPDGVVHGVRMERKLAGQKKNTNWSWFKNPFVGTRELNGLKTMMALINNWDLKEVNNAIYNEKGAGPRYVVSDLGASFGSTGNTITRSKSSPGEYGESKFIQKVTAEHVDFIMSSRPVIFSVFDVSNYAARTHMQEVVKDIPLADARWLAKLLAPLSDEQIGDCFRAAGYSTEQVEGYVSVVKERIKDLSGL